MAKHDPTMKLILVGEQNYRVLASEVESLMPDWELAPVVFANDRQFQLDEILLEEVRPIEVRSNVTFTCSVM